MYAGDAPLAERRAQALTLDRELLAAMAARLERRMAFDLSVSERTLYVSFADETLSSVVEARSLTA